MNRQVHKKYVAMQGFTLLEMIMVVVILAIVAVLGTRFVTESTRTYQAAQTRSVLINTGRQAVESMTRQLRVSLSYSVRITNVTASTNCLEFTPILGGGYYLDPVPDAVNGAPAANTILVAPHTVNATLPPFASIGAASSSEVYGVGAVSVAALNAETAVQLTLSANKSWQRNSLGQHFFLLDAPQAFCVIGTQLRYYTGQSITAASVDIATPGTYSLLATNVTSPAPFTISSGSENRNVVILFDLTFANSQSGESISLNQSVMIRNVP